MREHFRATKTIDDLAKFHAAHTGHPVDEHRGELINASKNAFDPDWIRRLILRGLRIQERFGDRISKLWSMAPADYFEARAVAQRARRQPFGLVVEGTLGDLEVEHCVLFLATPKLGDQGKSEAELPPAGQPHPEGHAGGSADEADPASTDRGPDDEGAGEGVSPRAHPSSAAARRRSQANSGNG